MNPSQQPEGPCNRSIAQGTDGHLQDASAGISRRGLLGAIGGAAALGGVAWATASPAAAAKPGVEASLPAGKPLRVKPALTYAIATRVEKTSWRGYGGLKTREDVDAEAGRIGEELSKLASQAEFPIELLPVMLVGSEAEAKAVVDAECDMILVYASGGDQRWLEMMASSGKPNIMFVRHKSGPLYLYYETAHWRFLRKSEDLIKEPNMGVEDIVVDDYGEVLWRLRALYGLTNTRGTKVIALGGLQAYSVPGQKLGPDHARKVWGFEIKEVPVTEVQQRLAEARANAEIMKDIERQVDAFLAQPNLTLQTEKRFLVNSFLALNAFKDVMNAAGATNIGVADCMRSLIGVLDTPPCLVLAMLNDEGLTAFCHTDFTHTPAGVLMRWISGKPSFVCNSHFPHDGQVTLAHCAAPRRMNGRDYEPTKVMTHFESDYGAATRVEYTRGQTTTTIIPNLVCTQWMGFRGKIIDVPNFDTCRSQMDVAIDGNWRKLVRDMQGFHTITTYGDYLREAGYVLRKVGMQWENFSEQAQERT
jgi:hypothetical protein